MGAAHRFTSLATRAGIVAMITFAAACASGGGGQAEAAAPSGATSLTIRNTDERGQALQVYLAREAGQERLLGTVGPGDQMTVPHTEGQGRFLFRAVRPDGSSVTSPVFNVVSGTYTWDLALGRVQRGR